MEGAEFKCRKFKMGIVTYFPGLAMKTNCVIFWKVIRRVESMSGTNNKHLTQMAKK